MAACVGIQLSKRWNRIQRYQRLLSSCLLTKHCYSTQCVSDEYMDTPQYPKIQDETVLGKRKRRYYDWYENIRLLPTVDEKLYHLIRHEKEAFGVHLEGLSPRYNTLPLKIHCTRTHILKGMPSVYNDVSVDEACATLKPLLQEAVILSRHRFSLDYPGAKQMSVEEQERNLTKVTVNALLRVLLGALAKKHVHLQDIQVDIDPRCEAFWYCGGFHPDKRRKSIREKVYKEFCRPPLDDPTDLCFLYEGFPVVQVRTKLPIPEYTPRDDVLCQSGDFPIFPYDPRTVGLQFKTRYPTLIPGFWPGDPYDFGHTSFHSREGMYKRRALIGERDENECLLEYGILASFGWLMSIATFQGFGPYTELTYPLATQTVITDGQKWSFFAYQLNTTCLFGNIQENPLRNLCWATDDMQLFEGIDDAGIHGWNDEVVKQLIKFIAFQPATRNVDLKPYLSKSETKPVPPDLDVKLSDWYSQRPPHRPKRYLYQWEKFYLRTGSYLSINPNRKRK